MKVTRREWGLTAAGLMAGGLGWLSCSPALDESPPERQSAGADAEGGLLEQSIVLDLHCDTPMLITEEGFDLGELHEDGQVDIPRMRQGGVSGVFFSIYTSATAQSPLASVKKALEIIDAVVREVERHPAHLVLATTAGEVVEAKKQGKIAILMGVEGGHMIDSSLGVLRTLFRLGARYLTLTHNGHTPWADSAAKPPASGGLTDFGRDLVREMNRLGMMVDISHVSDGTFFDAVETSAAPIIASHSSCRALADHPRNLSDEMLAALAQNGGVAHINYYNGFLDDDFRRRSDARKDFDALRSAVRKKYADDPKRRGMEIRKINLRQAEEVGRVPFSLLLDHFEHAAKVAGVDHVGLGSDFDGVSEQLPEGMEDISKIPNLVKGLRERGFSGPDIQKILGGNTLRVMREVERLASASASRGTTSSTRPVALGDRRTESRFFS